MVEVCLEVCLQEKRASRVSRNTSIRTRNGLLKQPSVVSSLGIGEGVGGLGAFGGLVGLGAFVASALAWLFSKT